MIGTGTAHAKGDFVLPHMQLDKIPRLLMGHYPTPLQDMPRLREALGENCPRLFIRRDDYTGTGFGGNKVRKAEYAFGHVRLPPGRRSS